MRDSYCTIVQHRRDQPLLLIRTQLSFLSFCHVFVRVSQSVTLGSSIIYLSANLVIFPCNFLQPCANHSRNFYTLSVISFWLVGKLPSSTLVFFLVDFHYFSALNLLTWHSVREEKWKDWGPRGLSRSLSRSLSPFLPYSLSLAAPNIHWISKLSVGAKLALQIGWNSASEFCMKWDFSIILSWSLKVYHRTNVPHYKGTILAG